jgi:hypothetical protein
MSSFSSPSLKPSTAATGRPKPTTTTPPPSPPSVIHGRGDDVVPVTRTGPKIVTFECPRCNSNTVLLSDGAESLLVNAIGPYSGKRWMDMANGSVTSQLTIKANSSWTLTIGGLESATHVSGPVGGHGDDVIVDTGSASSAAITNKGGQGNFVVEVISESTGSSDLTVNTIGGYSGTNPLSLPGIIQVTSDGSWSITPR